MSRDLLTLFFKFYSIWVVTYADSLKYFRIWDICRYKTLSGFRQSLALWCHWRWEVRLCGIIDTAKFRWKNWDQDGSPCKLLGLNWYFDTVPLIMIPIDGYKFETVPAFYKLVSGVAGSWMCRKIRDALDTDLVEYPANLKARYHVPGRISGSVFDTFHQLTFCLFSLGPHA